MKIYKGIRTSTGCNVIVINGDGNSYSLPMRLDLCNHSPTGFEWSYAGSGPSQLALALVADLTGNDEYALANYQEFKRYVIVPLKGDEWSFTEAALREFC